MNKSARRCVFCTVSANWTSALWCGNVHRTHIISLVFEKVKLRLINLWEHITSKAKKKKKKKKKILQAKLKICEYGKNNKQSYDYSFFNQLDSSKDFDFVGWVIKTPCASVFSQCKVSLWERNTPFDVGENCSSISAQNTTKQIFVKICWQLKTPSTRTWKRTRCTMQMSFSYLPFKNFSKLAKQA